MTASTYNDVMVIEDATDMVDVSDRLFDQLVDETTNDGVRKLEDLQPRHLDKKVERSPPEDDMSTIIAELKAEEEGTRGVG